MGQLVFQATAGGQVALVGPNPSASFSLNVPAVSGTLVTTGDTGTVTNTMLASNAYTAPGAIGSVTPSTGAFTTLSASSTVSGAGFSTYLASPPAIGGTAAAAGTFTTLTVGGNTQNQQLGQGNASIMKNRIINGAMMISQRGTSFTPALYDYTLDRYQTQVTQSSKFTIAQSTTAPAGFGFSMLATSSSAYSITSTDCFAEKQYIEGFNFYDCAWGTANAKTVTLSFWVQSSLTGTFGGALQNAAGNRSYPYSYTISSANTWTQVSVTISGDTTGTWVGATNGVGCVVIFSLGMGSTLSNTAGAWAAGDYRSATGATSVVGTNGATFYITGVQLEVGSSATGFEYRQYQQELALCQRYFWKPANLNIAQGWGSSSTTVARVFVKFPVTMRSTPSVTALGVITLDDQNASYTQSSTSFSDDGLNADGGRIFTANYTGLTTYRPVSVGNSSNNAWFSAEL